MKRTTPEDDVMRLAERVWATGQGRIQSVEDYNRVFDYYMKPGGEKLSSKQEKKLRQETFNALKGRHPRVVGEKALPETKKKEKEKAYHAPAEFKYLGYVGSRPTYLRATRYIVKGKTRTAYRDEKGRFGSISTAPKSQPSVTSRIVAYDPTTGKYVRVATKR